MALKVYGAKAFRKELKGVIRDIRVTWLCEELGVPYEHIILDPTKGENKTPEYLKLNPMGKVPTIVDDGFALFESAAICEYLATKHGKLIPKHGTTEYWLCKQWTYFAVSNVEPQCSRLYAAQYFLEPGEVTEGVKKLALDVLPRFLKPLDDRLGGGKFVLGSEFSFTDVLLGTMLGSISWSPILNDYPNVKNYLERLQSRPAYKKAYSANGGV